MSEDEREVLTEKEAVELRRSGSSDVLHLPAHWKRSFPFLKSAKLFEATIERDQTGAIFIVFRKVPAAETRKPDERR
jgi:hypothetical protein